MAREIRKAARDAEEDVAAHHGLVKMIPQWERGGRAPSERYRMLYLRIFRGTPGDVTRSTPLSWDVALQIAEIRARATRLPGAGDITELAAEALARPRTGITAAEIRALTAATISRLHEVADNLAKLSALLGDDDEGISKAGNKEQTDETHEADEGE